MFARAVAFVAGKAVVRVEGVHLAHERVAVYLGEDARRAHGIGEGVAVHHAAPGNGDIEGKIPVRETKSGGGESPSTARFMHRRVASKMLRRSMASQLSSQIL